MANCIFCKIVAGDIPCVRVYEDDEVLAFMDINPLSHGHTLVIPKQHAENLWEISEKDLSAVHAAAKKIVQAMKKTLGKVSVAALQLNGRGVNQVVMHYHLHLIPHADEASPLTLTAWDMIPGDMEAIKRVGRDIADAIG